MTERAAPAVFLNNVADITRDGKFNASKTMCSSFLSAVHHRTLRVPPLPCGETAPGS